MTMTTNEELIAEARERAGYMALLADLTNNQPGAVRAREEADRMTRFADALESLADRLAALTTPQEGEARERLVNVLVMTPMADAIYGDLTPISRTADAILAAFPVLSRDIAGEIEADKHPVADERVEYFNAGLDRAAEIVRNRR